MDVGSVILSLSKDQFSLRPLLNYTQRFQIPRPNLHLIEVFTLKTIF